MKEIEIDIEAKKMVQQVKHYVITMMGKTFSDATSSEVYRTLAYVLREQVMIHWAATRHTQNQEKVRKLSNFF